MWSITIALVAALLLGERAAAAVLLACGLSLDVFARLVMRRSSREISDLRRRCGSACQAAPQAPKPSSIETTMSQIAACLAWSAAAAAGLTYAMTRNAQAALSVTIVAGTAGLVLAPRLAMRSAVGRAARDGVLMGDGACVERLWDVEVVVLPKSTMTRGHVQVRAIYPATGIADEELLEVAAMAESRSDHPIGQAIVEHAARHGIVIRKPDRFTASPGQGVRARCDGQQILVGTGKFVTDGRFLDTPDEGASPTVYVTRGGQYLGAIAIANRMRADVRQAVADLHGLGIHAHCSRSDSTAAGGRVADECGVDAIDGNLLPALGVERMAALVRDGRVAVVEGAHDISDGSSRRTAVTFAAPTDAAFANPETLLTNNDDIPGLVVAIRLARRARGVIRTSVAGTVMIDVLGIAVVAAGMMTPLTAACVNALSSLILTLNAVRMLASSRSDPIRNSDVGLRNV